MGTWRVRIGWFVAAVAPPLVAAPRGRSSGGGRGGAVRLRRAVGHRRRRGHPVAGPARQRDRQCVGTAVLAVRSAVPRVRVRLAALHRRQGTGDDRLLLIRPHPRHRMPVAVNASARFRVDLVVHRNCEPGSPRLAGPVNASDAPPLEHRPIQLGKTPIHRRPRQPRPLSR